MIVLTGALALAGTAGGAIASMAAEPSAMAGKPFTATLNGASETPPADQDGVGSFSATLNPAHDQLCYELKADKIDTATAAHIHAGKVGVAGPPVVMLQAPANGMAKACAAVTMDLAMKLMAHPEDYYVNVHNAAYPAGAIRGQLKM